MDTIGIIGGSGLYGMSGFGGAQKVEIDTPWGKPSGRITTGEMGGVRIAFLPRHGKGHTLLPSEINYRANIYALKELGVRRIISVSAVGSLKEGIAPGHVVIPHQFIDHTKRRESSFFGGGVVAHISMANPVCPKIGGALVKASKQTKAKLHKGGVYLCIEGPQFSTRAESELYRSWGADIIGMTNMPEAKLAREAEMCYGTLALATDYDCWHPGHAAVTVQDIVETLTENVKTAQTIIKKAVESLAPGGEFAPGDGLTGDDCPCGKTLDNAIITWPDRITDEAKRKLGIVASRVLK